MIKKIFLLLFLLIAFSCGKKGDPVFNESFKKNNLITTQINKV